MEIFFTQSMFWGPIRIVLFILFCYYINRLIVKEAAYKNGLDYFIINYTLTISSIILIIFFLTQINGFDVVFLFIIISVIALLTFLDLKKKHSLKNQFKIIKRRFIIYTIKKFEKGDTFISKKNIKKKHKRHNVNSLKANTTKTNWQIGIAIFIALLSVISIYFFFLFDTYTLSDTWYSDLATIKDITEQNWFFHPYTMMGEFAIINFYSKITGISDAIALTSFAVLESTLLAVVLFWFVNKITNSTIIAGLISALTFILLFSFLPLNLNLITQPKSIFLGLTILLPFIAYAFKPPLMTSNSAKYAFFTLLTLLAIGLVDLFLFLFLVPIIITIALAFNWRIFKKQSVILLKSYVTALILLFLVHYIAAEIRNYNLLTFIFTNLFSFKNYTYSPQLILPLNELIQFYTWLTLAFLGLSLFLWKIKKRNFKLITMLFVFLFTVFNLHQLKLSFIDQDPLNQVLSVLIPILFGLVSFTVLKLIKPITDKFKLNLAIKTTLTLLIFSTIAITLERDSLVEYPKKNKLNEQILSVYDKMFRELLPYSFAVVNNEKNARMGESSHYFINYSFFNLDYLGLDENYQKYRKDEQYLKENPNFVLPKSVFVFVYDKSAISDVKNEIDIAKQEKVLQTIAALKKRGRKVELFFNKPSLKVYQIINEPKASKISDLLF